MDDQTSTHSDVSKIISQQFERLRQEAILRQTKLRVLGEKVKTLAAEWDNLLQDALGVKTESMKTPETSQKRKRGRPRKDKTSQPMEATAKSSGQRLENASSVAYSDIPSEESWVDNLIETKVKRKPGRPKKVKDETTEVPKTITRKKQV